MQTMLPDYHIHTRLCKHAEGEMHEYVESAIARGIHEFGFSDHMPVMPESKYCMDECELEGYVTAVLDLRRAYAADITVKLGCEMDIVPDRLDDIRNILAAYPFDYVIGSIHYLDGWPFDQWQYHDTFETGNVDAIYNRFFAVLLEGADTGFYDIVGHLDLIKCLGYFPNGDLSAWHRRIAGELAARGLTVELNMSGLDKPCAEQYPSAPFLAALAKAGVPVTVGSDAHQPEQVARHYDRASDLLCEAGYAAVQYFDRRRRIPVPI